jgi:hypothetical protein
MNTPEDIDGNRIRARLLNQLGFMERTSRSFDFSPVSLRKRLVSFSMPLKSKEETRKKTAVVFDDNVSVVSIPSHADYSERIRSRVWADRYEIAAMASRNMLEFASEGFDWRNVAGDEDMLHIEGKLIHPIHGKPLLAAALKRRIPYPRAISPAEERESSGPHEESGAVYSLDELIERPSCPLLENDSDDSSVDEDEDYYPSHQGYKNTDPIYETVPY